MTVPRGRRHRDACARVLAISEACHWCNRPISKLLPVGHPQKATCDHLVPVVDGGQDVVENYVASCHRCNSSRGRKGPGWRYRMTPGSADW